MIASLGPLVLAFGMLSALAIIAGGIILFAVGKGRGALPGAGFVVLGAGTGISGLISVLLPQISLDLHLASTAVSGLYSGIWLIFSLIGWGLVVAALFRFRAEKVDTPGGYPPPPPGGHPGYLPPAGPGPDPRRPPYGA